MPELKKYTETSKPSNVEKRKIIEFLFQHLENFGDPIMDIEKAIDYALKEYQSFGGFILVLYEGIEILGAVVIDYIGQTEPPVSDQTEPPLSDQMEPCLSDETEPPF